MNLYFRVRVRFRFINLPLRISTLKPSGLLLQIFLLWQNQLKSTRKLWLHQLIYYCYSRIQHRHEELFEFQSNRKYFAVKTTENNDRKLSESSLLPFAVTFSPENQRLTLLRHPTNPESYISQHSFLSLRPKSQNKSTRTFDFFKVFFLCNLDFFVALKVPAVTTETLCDDEYFTNESMKISDVCLWFWALCSSGWLLQPPPTKYEPIKRKIPNECVVSSDQ